MLGRWEIERLLERVERECVEYTWKLSSMPPPPSGMLTPWVWAPIPELEIALWVKGGCQPPALPSRGPQCPFSAVSMGAKNESKECLTVFSVSLYPSLSPPTSPLFPLLPYYSPLSSQCPVLLLGNQIRFQKKVPCFLLSDCTHFVQESNLFILYYCPLYWLSPGFYPCLVYFSA